MLTVIFPKKIHQAYYISCKRNEWILRSLLPAGLRHLHTFIIVVIFTPRKWWVFPRECTPCFSWKVAKFKAVDCAMPLARLFSEWQAYMWFLRHWLVTLFGVLNCLAWRSKHSRFLLCVHARLMAHHVYALRAVDTAVMPLASLFLVYAFSIGIDWLKRWFLVYGLYVCAACCVRGKW